MNDTISGREIVEKLVKQSGIKRKQAVEILRVIPGIIEEGLNRDGEVRVKGLGTFRLKWTRGKVGRNPKTGERVDIPAHNRPVFIPEHSFKDYINRDYRLLGYKIIPSGTPETIEEEIIPPPLPVPEPEPEARSEPEAEPEREPEITPMKRRVHWIIPAAIGVIAVLFVIFCIRNFYQVEKKSAVSGQQRSEATSASGGSAVSNEQPAAERSNVPAQSAVSSGAERRPDSVGIGGQQSAVGSGAERRPDSVGIGGQQPAVNNENSELNTQNSTLSTQHSELRTLAEGKHLFQLAREIYGNPYLWVLIYKENQEKIPDPDMVVSGIDLKIPKLEGSPEKLSEKDSMAVSEGYRLLYEYYKARNDPRAEDFRKAMNRFKGR